MQKIRHCLKITLFFIVLGFAVVGISAAADLEINDQNTTVGSSVTFTVSVNTAPNDVSALGFDISYDSSILAYDRFEKGPLAETGFGFFGVSAPSSGLLRVGGVAAAGGNPISQGASGALVTLVFHVITVGSCDVSIVDLKDNVATWTTRDGRFVSGNIPVNTKPVSHDQNVTAEENTPVDITLDAFDADGDILTYQVVLDPTFGTLTGMAPDLTYTPDQNYAGPDFFTFRANDGQENSGIATVRITVEPADTPVNSPPQASDMTVETDANTPVSVTLSASDPDGDALSYQVVNPPLHGTLTGAAPNLVYTPEAGYSGSDTFTFKADDGEDESNTATVTVTVSPTIPDAPDNSSPLAFDQTIATTEDTPVSITLTATDADGDALTYEIVDSPASGALTGTPPALTYTPAAGFDGSDSFMFKANDGQSDSNTASVLITVEAKPVDPDPVGPTPEPTPQPTPTPGNTSNEGDGGGGGGGCFVSVTVGG